MEDAESAEFRPIPARILIPPPLSAAEVLALAKRGGVSAGLATLVMNRSPMIQRELSQKVPDAQLKVVLSAIHAFEKKVSKEKRAVGQGAFWIRAPYILIDENAMDIDPRPDAVPAVILPPAVLTPLTKAIICEALESCEGIDMTPQTFIVTPVEDLPPELRPTANIARGFLHRVADMNQARQRLEVALEETRTELDRVQDALREMELVAAGLEEDVERRENQRDKLEAFISSTFSKGSLVAKDLGDEELSRKLAHLRRLESQRKRRHRQLVTEVGSLRASKAQLEEDLHTSKELRGQKQSEKDAVTKQVARLATRNAELEEQLIDAQRNLRGALSGEDAAINMARALEDALVALELDLEEVEAAVGIDDSDSDDENVSEAGDRLKARGIAYMQLAMGLTAAQVQITMNATLTMLGENLPVPGIRTLQRMRRGVGAVAIGVATDGLSGEEGEQLEDQNIQSDGTTKRGLKFNSFVQSKGAGKAARTYLLGIRRSHSGSAAAEGARHDEILSDMLVVMDTVDGAAAADEALNRLVAQITSATTDRGASEVKHIQDHLRVKVLRAKATQLAKVADGGWDTPEDEERDRKLLGVFIHLDCALHLAHNVVADEAKALAKVEAALFKRVEKPTEEPELEDDRTSSSMLASGSSSCHVFLVAWAINAGLGKPAGKHYNRWEELENFTLRVWHKDKDEEGAAFVSCLGRLFGPAEGQRFGAMSRFACAAFMVWDLYPQFYAAHKLHERASKLFNPLLTWTKLPEFRHVLQAHALFHLLFLEPLLAVESTLKHALDQADLMRQLVANLQEAVKEAETESYIKGDKVLATTSWRAPTRDSPLGRMAFNVPEDADAKEDVLGSLRLLLTSGLAYLEKARKDWLTAGSDLQVAATDPLFRAVTSSATSSSRRVESSLACLGSMRAVYPTMTDDHLETLLMSRFNGVAVVLASAIAEHDAGRSEQLQRLIKMADEGGRKLAKMKMQRVRRLEAERDKELEDEREVAAEKKEAVAAELVALIANLRKLGEIRTTEEIEEVVHSRVSNAVKIKRLQALVRVLKKIMGHTELKIAQKGNTETQLNAFEEDLTGILRTTPMPKLTEIEGMLQRGELPPKQGGAGVFAARAPEERHARLKAARDDILDERALGGDAAMMGLRLLGMELVEAHPDHGQPMVMFFAAGARCLKGFACWCCGKPDPETIVICERCGRGFHYTAICMSYQLKPDTIAQLPAWFCETCCEMTGAASPPPEFRMDAPAPMPARGRGRGRAVLVADPKAAGTKRRARAAPKPASEEGSEEEEESPVNSPEKKRGGNVSRRGLPSEGPVLEARTRFGRGMRR